MSRYSEVLGVVRELNRLIDERKTFDFQSFEYEDITYSIRDLENRLFELQELYGFVASQLKRSGHWTFVFN